jgi:two-component system, NarL family, response regulator NreC
LRVWLIDDHELIREGLRGLIEKTNTHFVVKESGTLGESRTAAPAAGCDIVLLDLTLPDGDGIPFIKELRTMRPDLPILALTMHSTQERVLGALEAGASGYLVKSASEEDLLSAIETVGNGGTYIHSAVTPFVLQSFREPQVVGSDGKPALRERELEILICLAEGMSNQEIARKCLVSVSTVKSHVSKLFEHFGASDRANLVYEAMKAGALSHE